MYMLQDGVTVCHEHCVCAVHTVLATASGTAESREGS